MTTKRSPGALRVARKMFGSYIVIHTDRQNYNPVTSQELAAIIDRETGASDLLAALKEALTALTIESYDKGTANIYNTGLDGKPTDYAKQLRRHYIDIIQLAITKAEPPTQNKKGD